jgi:hypothetical protein
MRRVALAAIGKHITPSRNESLDPRCILFTTIWIFIILVSVIDGYLMLEYRHNINELNPQGRLLMEWNDGDVWYLLAAKTLGTIAACSILHVIYTNSRRVGTNITMVIGMLQFGLLMFLCLA